jgi:hypothetical protein
MLRLNHESPAGQKFAKLMELASELGIQLSLDGGFLLASFLPEDGGNTYRLVDAEDLHEPADFPPLCEYQLVREG